ncbi:MAG: PrsW family glutamic-type intramembrane protease [Firmicutes bacterium]|nr:PrsW family glutamic-type intramembrane protease [Bacillota bacterium]
MALIKCEECGKEISSSAKICPNCGYKNDNKTCPECGIVVKQSDSVCPECGFPLQKKNAQNIINENLDKIIGAKSENYVTFKDLFKNTFKKHTEEELDEVFICGGEKTTPDLKDVDPTKASAWVYFKILLFFIIAYVPVRIGFISYGNSNFLPAMVMLAAFAVPVTILIFFFEINVFRNIPFYKVMKYFVWGGGLSLILAILFFSLDFNTDISTYDGALMVGLIEEAAKATIVAIFLFKSKKSNYILDGLLIGAAVGAGFAAFETAGYILRFGLNNGLSTMLQVIKLRGFLAPGGHVAWAAIEGAALMYVKGFDKLDKKHLNDKRFLFICLIPIILHGVWDMPINTPYYLLQIALTVIAWLVIIYFINLGLKQVDDAKKLKK